jgi:TRAP-type C4-dicarboxylate transport system permease large subunit
MLVHATGAPAFSAASSGGSLVSQGKFGVDPVHFGMIMLLNLGIGLCHPPVGATLFVGCAVGRVRMED